MLYISIIITFFLILSGFIKIKDVNLLKVKAIWLWVLTGFNIGGIDYPTNKAIYSLLGENLSITGKTTWLESILVYISNNVGFSYFEYNAVIALLSVTVLYNVIKKYATDPEFVFSCIFIYPLSDMVIQKRFFPCLAFVTLALIYLVNGQHKKFVITLFIAIGFHFSAVFYLIFMLAYFSQRKWVKRLIYFFIMMESYFVFFNIKSLFNFSGMFIPMSKMESYFSKSISSYASFFFVAYFLVMIFIIRFYFINYRDIRIHKLVEVNTISVLLIPFLIYNAVFVRLFSPIFIVNYIYMSGKIKESLRKLTVRGLTGYSYITLIFLSTIIRTVFNKGNGISETINTVFSYNFILRGLS